MRKYWWIAAAAVIVDQAVKCACMSLTRQVTIIPGVLALNYTENTGMAFSLFSGRAWLLGVVSAVCIIGGWLTLRKYQLGAWSKVGAMLMLGGAVGNMIDRFLRGYVVDMFEALFVRFAIFNVADVALTVGTALMAVSLIFRPEEWQERQAAKET